MALLLHLHQLARDNTLLVHPPYECGHVLQSHIPVDPHLSLWVGSFRVDSLLPVHNYRVQIRWYRRDDHLFQRHSRQQDNRGGWRTTFKQAPRLAPTSSCPHAGFDDFCRLRGYGCGIGCRNNCHSLQRVQFQHIALDALARLRTVLPDRPLS